jgi:hypothetical protein
LVAKGADLEMTDEGPNEIDLQLTSQLEKEGIVTRAVFYRKTSGIQVLLNHQYDSKTIVTSIDLKDWNNTHDIFEKTLKRKGVKAQHIPLLTIRYFRRKLSRHYKPVRQPRGRG